jgi:hypothetical protein
MASGRSERHLWQHGHVSDLTATERLQRMNTMHSSPEALRTAGQAL